MVRRWRLDCGLCVVYIREVGAMLLVGKWYHGNKNKLAERKAFDDSMTNIVAYACYIRRLRLFS